MIDIKKAPENNRSHPRGANPYLLFLFHLLIEIRRLVGLATLNIFQSGFEFV